MRSQTGDGSLFASYDDADIGCLHYAVFVAGVEVDGLSVTKASVLSPCTLYIG